MWLRLYLNYVWYLRYVFSMYTYGMYYVYLVCTMYTYGKLLCRLFVMNFCEELKWRIFVTNIFVTKWRMFFGDFLKIFIDLLIFLPMQAFFY